MLTQIITMVNLPLTGKYCLLADFHSTSVNTHRTFDHNKNQKIMSDNHNTNRKTWLGIVLVIIGVYYLLSNFNLIPDFIPHYFTSWEMIFVLVGGAMLATGRRAGLVFLLIGGISLLPQIFYWPQIHLRDWWPLILIAIGISIFLKRRNVDFPKRHGKIDDDYIDEVSIFGGTEKSISSQNFKGGKVTSVFGGSEISFLSTKLSNEENVIDVFCLFGGSSFIVPSDWTVVMDSFIIFGGFSDKRPLTSNANVDPSKVLRIKGFVMFGGGEIKSI
ncbi:MAG: putative membrane protein [Cyclobacteriaceae bacterium]|jgi:predicted membrane protein